MKLQELVDCCLGPGFQMIRRPTFPADVSLRVCRVPSLKPALPHSYVPTSNENYPMATFEVWVGKTVVCYGWVPSLDDLVADDWCFGG